MKKVLAVSGGLDSMVLLHKFRNDTEVVVAHFNHGTRPSANADQLFVEHWAKKYRKPFYAETAKLGPNVSEEQARFARYNFLSKIAENHRAKILTAHHADDLLETIIINLLRGTGWRGLSPFSQPNIERPLLVLTKNQLRQYAAEHQITYREDPTNQEDHYLRNRIRQKLIDIDARTKQSVCELANQQSVLRAELEQILADLLPKDNFYPRAWFQDLDDNIAIELLKTALSSRQISATRPQLNDFLAAIRSYQPGKQFNLPNGKLIRLHKDYFML